MKQFITLISTCLLVGQLFAQQPSSGYDALYGNASSSSSKRSGGSSVYDATLKPFYHGVASGDPLQDRVIIWTRVTPEDLTSTVDGTWAVATDTNLTDTISTGTFSTDASKDFTVKIDATGLQANTTYYYVFQALDANSLIGRTKTAPSGNDASHLRFGVVSCSNYEAGYFNAYKKISDRNDLDAIIHLGDYIYEYPSGYYGDTVLQQNGERNHDSTETVELDQYRARYSIYRLDPDLRSAHQQHAFINIWDDHETANDAWKDGAENHDPATEGNWNDRKNDARKAFFEWIPIRDNGSEDIYRTLNYGNLVDLIMLDTRIEGREEQINDITNPAMYAPNRTMLGATQRNWFLDAINNSTAKWKIVGNQVIFSEFHVGFAGDTATPAAALESIFLDIWDGYPAERLQIINYLESNNIDNVVFLTGDFHSTFAFDVADSVTDPGSFYAPTPNYDPSTGMGSVAVEFATPSITSANFDENLDPITAAGLEFQINNPLPIPGTTNFIPNPHMKYTDLDQHGYFILDIKEDSTQANWYFMDRINTTSDVEAFGEAWYTADGANHLTQAATESPEKTAQAIPAPANPPVVETPNSVAELNSVEVVAMYPNPSSEYVTLQLGLRNQEAITVTILDLKGNVIRTVIEQSLSSGMYNLRIETETLPAGMYIISVNTNDKQIQQSLIKE